MHSNPNYSNDCLERQRHSLEALVSQPEQPRRQVTWSQRLTALGKAVVRYLSQPQTEPRIWSRRRGDMTLWFVYDPYTQQRQHFTSEADLRSWLDQRYYQ